jgi:hypothetical protein
MESTWGARIHLTTICAGNLTETGNYHLYCYYHHNEDLMASSPELGRVLHREVISAIRSRTFDFFDKQTILEFGAFQANYKLFIS